MKPTYFLLVAIAFYAIQANAAAVKPRNLEEEVKVQLEELKTTVRGAIFKAIEHVETTITDVYHYRDGALEDAKLSITQEYQTLNDSMTQLKDAASFTNKDPDPCLKFREDLLYRMPLDTLDSLSECIANFNEEVTIVNNDARYRIDSQMSQVDVFDFQIAQCKGEESCFSAIAEQIDKSLFKIPQTVDKEVQNAQELLTVLKVGAEDCANSRVSHYATEGTKLFEAISICVADWPSE